MSTDEYLEEDDYLVQRPPVWILHMATVVVVLALALAFRPGLTSNVIGYALGSFACVGAVALFIKVDSSRRTSANVVYLERPAVRYFWSAVLMMGIAVCGVHAWKVAEELAARS